MCLVSQTMFACSKLRAGLLGSNRNRDIIKNRSLDLNPIEDVWDELGRTGLDRGCEESWENMDQNLIRSMPAKIQAVIYARGGNPGVNFVLKA